MQPRLAGVLAVLVGAGLAGCAGSPREPATSPASVRPADAPTTTSAPAYLTPSGPLSRCGPQPAQVSQTGFRYRVVHDRRLGAVPVVTAGDGPTVAVLLHQTDGNGLCGWLPFAAKIVQDPSVTILAVDLCGYGEATCRDGVDSVDVASAAVDMARDELHARRVVVVGASMGGSIALVTAVAHGRVDAAVDLSGPVEWPGMASVRGGRALRVPVLVAMADTESPADVSGAREIVAHAPKGSRFQGAPSGHGYDLLLDPNGQPGPLAAPLLAVISG